MLLLRIFCENFVKTDQLTLKSTLKSTSTSQRNHRHQTARRKLGESARHRNQGIETEQKPLKNSVDGVTMLRKDNGLRNKTDTSNATNAQICAWTSIIYIVLNT